MKPIERVVLIIKHEGLSISAFEKATGMSNNSIQTAIKRNSNLKDDTLNSILNTYKYVNPEWLLTGQGMMIREKKTTSNITPNITPNKNILTEPTEDYKLIPLIPVDAIAGWVSGDISSITDTDINLERYVVPEFQGVDFLIRVKGSSMYPKYSSGDIVACTYIKESRFIQWGKVYVLDSTQGALVKRLFKSDDQDCIECRSDNEAYPPFLIPKDEIRGMALVIGVIRLE
jgi:repressor LexA